MSPVSVPALQGQSLSLSWTEYPSGITKELISLVRTEELVDCTIAVDDQTIPAHKLVLAACSPYFRRLFHANPCKHPIVFVANATYRQVRALVDFMYNGTVVVIPNEVADIMKLANSFQIRGLYVPEPKAPEDELDSSIETEPLPNSNSNVSLSNADTPAPAPVPVPATQTQKVPVPAHTSSPTPSPLRVVGPTPNISAPTLTPNANSQTSSTSTSSNQNELTSTLPMPMEIDGRQIPTIAIQPPTPMDPGTGTENSETETLDFEDLIHQEIPFSFYQKLLGDQEMINKLTDSINEKLNAGTSLAATANVDQSSSTGLGLGLGIAEEVSHQTVSEVDQYINDFLSTLGDEDGTRSEAGGLVDGVEETDEIIEENENSGAKISLESKSEQKTELISGQVVPVPSVTEQRSEKNTSIPTTFTVNVSNQLIPNQNQMKKPSRKRRGGPPIGIIDTSIHQPENYDSLWQKLGRRSIAPKIPKLDNQEKNNVLLVPATLPANTPRFRTSSTTTFRHSPPQVLPRSAFKEPPIGFATSKIQHQNQTAPVPLPQPQETPPSLPQIPSSKQPISVPMGASTPIPIVGTSFRHSPKASPRSASVQITGTRAKSPGDLPVIHMEESPSPPQNIEPKLPTPATAQNMDKSNDEILEPKTPAQTPSQSAVSVIVTPRFNNSANKQVVKTPSSLLSKLFRSSKKVNTPKGHFTDLTSKPILNDRKSFSTPRKKHVRTLNFSTPQRTGPAHHIIETPVRRKSTSNPNANDLISPNTDEQDGNGMKTKKRLDWTTPPAPATNVTSTSVKPHIIETGKFEEISEPEEMEDDEEEENDVEEGEIPSPPPVEIDLTNSPSPVPALKVTPPAKIPIPAAAPIEQLIQNKLNTSFELNPPSSLFLGLQPPPTPRIKGSEPNSFYDWQPGGSFYLPTPAKDMNWPPRTPGRTPDGSRQGSWSSITETPDRPQPASLETPNPKIVIFPDPQPQTHAIPHYPSSSASESKNQQPIEIQSHPIRYYPPGSASAFESKIQQPIETQPHTTQHHPSTSASERKIQQPIKSPKALEKEKGSRRSDSKTHKSHQKDTNAKQSISAPKHNNNDHSISKILESGSGTNIKVSLPKETEVYDPKASASIPTPPRPHKPKLSLIQEAANKILESSKSISKPQELEQPEPRQKHNKKQPIPVVSVSCRERESDHKTKTPPSPTPSPKNQETKRNESKSKGVKPQNPVHISKPEESYTSKSISKPPPLHPKPKVTISNPKVQEAIITSTNPNNKKERLSLGSSNPTTYSYTVSGRPKKLTISEQQGVFGLLEMGRVNMYSPPKPPAPAITNVSPASVPEPAFGSSNPNTSNTSILQSQSQSISTSKTLNKSQTKARPQPQAAPPPEPPEKFNSFGTSSKKKDISNFLAKLHKNK